MGLSTTVEEGLEKISNTTTTYNTTRIGYRVVTKICRSCYSANSPHVVDGQMCMNHEQDSA